MPTKSEVDKVVPVVTTITGIDGTKIPVPPVTMRMEVAIWREVSSAIKEVWGEREKDASSVEELGMKVIATLLSEAPERLATIVALMLGKQGEEGKSWVLDNISSDQVADLVGPFCVARISKWRKVLQPLQSAMTG